LPQESMEARTSPPVRVSRPSAPRSAVLHQHATTLRGELQQKHNVPITKPIQPCRMPNKEQACSRASRNQAEIRSLDTGSISRRIRLTSSTTFAGATPSAGRHVRTATNRSFACCRCMRKTKDLTLIQHVIRSSIFSIVGPAAYRTANSATDSMSISCPVCSTEMPLLAAICDDATGNDPFGVEVENSFVGNGGVQMIFHLCRECSVVSAYHSCD
jgi:hypothetical protein